LTKRKIAVIGAGKLAHSLVTALLKSGYDIECVVSRQLSSAKSFSKKFSIRYYSNSVLNIPPDVNTFFLTVPDGEIKQVAVGLSKLKRDFKHSICIHFSGVENISALKSLSLKGCIIGSLHIIRPFPSKDIVDIKKTPASVEANHKRALAFLNQLCKKLKLKPHRIKSDEKVFHHLAAVHSSNFLVGNLYNAFSLISSKNNSAKDSLKKTTQSALNNIFNLSPAKALSGPVDRGDVYTITKHLQAFDNKIRSVKDKGILKLIKRSYVLQSLLLLNVAEKKYGGLNENHLKIKKYLGNILSKLN